MPVPNLSPKVSPVSAPVEDTAPPSTTPVVSVEDLVVVVLHEPTPFIMQWDSKRYVLKPETEAYVPFPAACLYFGDPRSSELVIGPKNRRAFQAWIPDRRTEVRRLRALYGILKGNVTTLDPCPETDNRPPRVTMRTLSGEELVPVVMDPFGASVTPVTKSVNENDTLLSRIEKYEREMAAMRKALEARNSVNPSEGVEGVEDDDDLLAVGDQIPEDGK